MKKLGLLALLVWPALAASSPAQVLCVDGAEIRVHHEDGALSHLAAAKAWIGRAGRAVSRYYGHFPVPVMDLRLVAVPGRGVESGTQFHRRPPLVRVLVGRDTDRAGFRDDWVLVHEMVHTAFPALPRGQRWLEEGLAVYVESIARMRDGELSADHVWSEFLGRMPAGTPRPGDRGLDHDHRWARIYWGGAFFALVADVRIRRRTRDRLGLEDALRAILRAKEAGTRRADARRVLQLGDEATGTRVLIELYEQMALNPGGPDLPAFFRNLGVSTTHGGVRYDGHAPLAAERRAIEAGDVRRLKRSRGVISR